MREHKGKSQDADGKPGERDPARTKRGTRDPRSRPLEGFFASAIEAGEGEVAESLADHGPPEAMAAAPVAWRRTASEFRTPPDEPRGAVVAAAPTAGLSLPGALAAAFAQ